jgi:hypothetical protein
MRFFDVLIQLPSQSSQVAPTPPASSWLGYLLYVPLLAALATVLNLLLGQVLPRLNAKRDKRSLEKNIAGGSYTLEEIQRSRDFYVVPFVQNIDPMGSEEPRALVGLKQKLYAVLDELLDQQSEHRYIILLADSGMGKTSALMNYTIRQVRRRWKRHYDAKLIPLSSKNATEQINGCVNRHSTVLFLDALDEDIHAIRNHQTRLGELMEIAQGFHRVVVSCRTQFFPSDEEIPREVGIVKVATRAAGEPAEYIFHKLYLSPFTEKQARKYLRRRYPLRRITTWGRRRRALQMADKIPHLATRPLLLAHIDVLIKDSHIQYAFEIYEEMVKKWLIREEGFIKERHELRRFSELLAVNLCVNLSSRGGASLPRQELSQLASSWGIPVEDRQLSDYRFSTRSLLNRDADGNYKFAHKSIMEYLCVKRFWEGDDQCGTVEWTGEMRTFYWEMLEQYIVAERSLPYCTPDSAKCIWLDEQRGEFLKEVIKVGVSLLRTPKVAERRLNAILETTTALCGLLIDPESIDDPVISLVGVKKGFKRGECEISPIAIYHHWKLLDTKDALGLQRHKQAIEQAFYGDFVPNIDADRYATVLSWLKREVDGLSVFMMPIKEMGVMTAVLIGETSRLDYAFRDNRQLQLLEILKLVGKRLRERQ